MQKRKKIFHFYDYLVAFAFEQTILLLFIFVWFAAFEMENATRLKINFEGLNISVENGLNNEY